MPRTLVKKTKKTTKEELKKKAPEVSDSEEDTETDEEEKVLPLKKAVIEIDEPEPIVAVDEKIEDDALPVTDDEDVLGSEEIAIDDEELDPFGDKWEE